MDAPVGSLDELARRRNEVLGRLIEGFQDDRRVKAAWLLGSFGRQEADEWSDLDLQVAVDDRELPAIMEQPDQLLDLPGPPVLVQAGWPSTSFVGGRFWLVIYDGPVEVDWSIGPVSTAVREEWSTVQFEREPIRVAPPPVAPSAEAIRRLVQVDLEFFWAMAPIAIKYIGRGHTRNAVNMIGLMTPTYQRIWRAVHQPQQLGRESSHGNMPDEAEFEDHAIRLGSSIDLGSVLAAIETMTDSVAAMHAPLAAAGHVPPDRMPIQFRALAAIARQATQFGGTSPDRHSRR